MSSPRRIRVRADGTGDAVDLATAIEHSRDGDLIELDEGEHRFDACLELDWELVVAGAGRELTKVRGEVPEDWWVVLEEGRLWLKDLRLERVAGSDEIAAVDVLGCRAGLVRLERVALSGAVEIDDNGGAGLRVEGGEAVLRDVEVEDCSFAGVVVQQGGRASYDGGSVRDCGLGCVVDEGASGFFERIRFDRIEQHAVVLLGKGSVEACGFGEIGGEEVVGLALEG